MNHEMHHIGLGQRGGEVARNIPQLGIAEAYKRPIADVQERDVSEKISIDAGLV